MAIFVTSTTPLRTSTAEKCLEGSRCLAATGADGVLSAVSLLENPSLFMPLSQLIPSDKEISNRAVDDPLHHVRKISLFKEYLTLVKRYPVKMGLVRVRPTPLTTGLLP